MAEAVALAAPLGGYYVSRSERVAYLSLILSMEPGAGHVGRLLDQLRAEHDVVIVPCVLSRRLAQMLDRRGFHRETHWVEHLQCPDPDTWVWRRPERIPGGDEVDEPVEAAEPVDQRARDRDVETAAGWPTSHEMIRQLRDAVGLFTGAMPISPQQAWEEALAEVWRLRGRRR